jgi:hypothetical protein
MLFINHKGQPYIYEGNNRIAYAVKHNIPHLNTEVQYINGGEQAEGPAHPNRIKELHNNLAKTPDDPAKIKNKGDKQMTSLAHIDPLFNPIAKPTMQEKHAVTASSQLTAANESPPTSPYTNTRMVLCEGMYEKKTFKMWVDPAARQAIPVRSN